MDHQESYHTFDVIYTTAEGDVNFKLIIKEKDLAAELRGSVDSPSLYEVPPRIDGSTLQFALPSLKAKLFAKQQSKQPPLLQVLPPPFLILSANNIFSFPFLFHFIYCIW
jgi:hypothetical protein